jgi:hypothetical protein
VIAGRPLAAAGPVLAGAAVDVPSGVVVGIPVARAAR